MERIDSIYYGFDKAIRPGYSDEPPRVTSRIFSDLIKSKFIGLSTTIDKYECMYRNDYFDQDYEIEKEKRVLAEAILNECRSKIKYHVDEGRGHDKLVVTGTIQLFEVVPDKKEIDNLRREIASMDNILAEAKTNLAKSKRINKELEVYVKGLENMLKISEINSSGYEFLIILLAMLTGLFVTLFIYLIVIGIL